MNIATKIATHRVELSKSRKVQCPSLYADLKYRDGFRHAFLASAIRHVKTTHHISHVMTVCWDEKVKNASKGWERALAALERACSVVPVGLRPRIKSRERFPALAK